MSKYIWANISVAVFLISLTVGVFLLKGDKHKNARRWALLLICILLLAYKTVEYIYYQAIGMRYKVPMEFSQVAYFIFPISVLLSKKASFSCLLARLPQLLRGFSTT